MMKWFIGVSASLILGAMGWMTTFIFMGYQAKADIETLSKQQVTQSKDSSELRAELRAVRAISERTEKNTEEIRNYLLNRAIK